MKPLDRAEVGSWIETRACYFENPERQTGRIMNSPDVKERVLALIDERDRLAANEKREYAEKCAALARIAELLWECPDCAFSFDREHATQATGDHDCPNCAEEKLTAERDSLASQLEAARNSIARLNDLVMNAEEELHTAGWSIDDGLWEVLPLVIAAALKESE